MGWNRISCFGSRAMVSILDAVFVISHFYREGDPAAGAETHHNPAPTLPPSRIPPGDRRTHAMRTARERSFGI
jgi:hypothetical protein